MIALVLLASACTSRTQQEVKKDIKEAGHAADQAVGKAASAAKKAALDVRESASKAGEKIEDSAKKAVHKAARTVEEKTR